MFYSVSLIITFTTAQHIQSIKSDQLLGAFGAMRIDIKIKYHYDNIIAREMHSNGKTESQFVAS